MKKLLTRTMLLLCALIAGSGTVWALDTYKKVTAATEIVDGRQYVLVCESKNVAMAVYSSGTYCAGVDVTITDSKVTAVTNINVLTLEEETDGWYIKQENGNYLYSSAAKSLKAENTTNKTLCTITEDFQIKMGSNGNLQYNSSSPRFCPYTSSQTAAYLYVKDEAEASPLASIAVSGSYATEFSQGEDFSHAGAIVTATYENGNTAVVTSSAIFSTPDMSTIGNKDVTVSYTEGEVTKTTTYSITVKEFVQPTTVEIALNNAFFGTSYTGANAKGSGSHSKKYKGITVSFLSGGDKNNFYISDSEIRAYSGNTLQFDAPQGYVFTEMEFANAWATNTTVDPGTLNSARKIWTKEDGATSVSYTPTSRSDITTVKITLAQLATVTLAAACTDGAKYYGTYSNDKAFVVPVDLTVSAIKVTDGVLAVSNYQTGDVVKAGTGVMVSAATAGDHTVVLTESEGTELEGNMLKASSVEMTDTDTKYYRLTMHNGTIIGFWWGAEDGAAFTIGANKAYLAVPNGTSATSRGFSFGDTTGISTSLMNSEKKNDAVFNLNGQRVTQPTRGLYIVNGRKVVIK